MAERVSRPASGAMRGAVFAGAVAAAIGCVLGGQWLAGRLLADGTAPLVMEATYNLVIFGLILAAAAAGAALTRAPLARIGAAPGRWLALGLLIGIGGLLLAVVDTRLAGELRPGGAATAAIGALVAGTLVVAVQAGAEEVLFRGWLQPYLAGRWGAPAAIGVAAIGFALVHLAGGARTPVELVNLLLGGGLFGALAWRSGGIVAPAAAHFGWNWAEELLLGLYPNPGTGAAGSFVDLDLVGRPLWGGSEEGLNASLAMTAVLLALLIPVALWRRGAATPVAVPAPTPATPPTASKHAWLLGEE